MKEHIKAKPIYYLGVGVFGFTALSSFSFLIGEIFEKFLMTLDISPALNIWSSDIVGLLFFLVFIYFLFNWYQGKTDIRVSDIRKYLTVAIISFIISQILVIGFTAFAKPFLYDNYTESFKKLSNFKTDHPSVMIIKAILGYADYAILGLIVFKSNKIVNLTIE